MRPLHTYLKILMHTQDFFFGLNCCLCCNKKYFSLHIQHYVSTLKLIIARLIMCYYPEAFLKFIFT